MRKIILTMLVAIMAASMLQAQGIISKGEKVANLGIGFGSYLGGSGYSTTVPPISLSVEYGVKDGLLDGKASIGVGGYLAYSANKSESTIPDPTAANPFQTTTFGFEYSYFIIGARGLFHYQFVDKLDTYAGLMLGYNAASSKSIGNNTGVAASVGGFSYSTFIGARYYFTPKWSAFAEIGYGIATIEIGISTKF
jgi:hypothetical protein